MAPLLVIITEYNLPGLALNLTSSYAGYRESEATELSVKKPQVVQDGCPDMSRAQSRTITPHKDGDIVSLCSQYEETQLT